MKIIHTSDWHLGNVLYGYDRMPQYESFLTQLVDIVKQEQPDCMIVSGDVYNTALPSAYVQKIYTDAMLQIHNACPDMTIVITAGNHDSPSRLETDSSLWNHFKVFVIGAIQKQDDGYVTDRHIIEVKNKENKSLGYIVAVPYFYQKNAPDIVNILLDKAESINKENLPVILSCHLAIKGSEIKSKSVHAQDFDYIDLDTFNDKYDYMALGHIHYPQTLPQSGKKARYCGSPIAVSFNEEYKHSVSIVEVHKETEPIIKTIEIKDNKPLITFPQQVVPYGEIFDLIKANKDILQNKFIRLSIYIEGFLPSDAKDRAIETCKEIGSDFCIFDIHRPQLQQSSNEKKFFTADEFKQITPISLANSYLQRKNIQITDEIEQMLLFAQNYTQNNDKDAD